MKYNILTVLLFSWSYLVSYPFKIQLHSLGQSNIFVIFDCHKEHPDMNLSDYNKQRNELLAFIKKCNGFVIVEDSQSPRSGITTLCYNTLDYDPSQYVYSLEELQNRENSTLGAPLLGFSSFCFYHAIPYKNIEFRHAKSNSEKKNSYISASTAYLISEKIAQEIAYYNDNAILNNFYRSLYTEYIMLKNNSFVLFNTLENSHESLFSLKQKISYHDCYRNVLETLQGTSYHLSNEGYIKSALQLYDSHFIEARIMHSIFAEQNNYKNIFVYVGGAHALRIQPVLSQLGYHHIFSLGNNFTHHDIGTKPQPDPIHLGNFENMIAQHFALIKSKQKNLTILYNGSEANQSEIVNKNLKNMCKNIRKIRNSRKKVSKKWKLHFPFKKS